MTQPEWSERLAGVVARELRRHREARAMSAQQLADACTQAGMPLQRSVIANFENGRRASIGVAELLMFANVLDVPPLSLICPAGYEPEMEILPNIVVDSYQAAYWISGHSYIGPERGKEGHSFDRSPLHLCRELTRELSMMAEEHDMAGDLRRIAQSKGMYLEGADVEYSFARREHEHASVRLREARQEGAKPEEAVLEALQAAEEHARHVMERAAVRFAEASRWNAKAIEHEREAEEHRSVVRDILQEIREAGYVEPSIGDYYRERLGPDRDEQSSTSRHRSRQE